ncbi:MAG: hypothetical protein V4704_03540 [Pseudomonadota bacterium]
MANNQNQKNRDDQTTNNQTNTAQRAQQDDRGQRGDPLVGKQEQEQAKRAPGRQDDSSSHR